MNMANIPYKRSDTQGRNWEKQLVERQTTLSRAKQVVERQTTLGRAKQVVERQATLSRAKQVVERQATLSRAKQVVERQARQPVSLQVCATAHWPRRRPCEVGAGRDVGLAKSELAAT
jgi:hypothetical protein